MKKETLNEVMRTLRLIYKRYKYQGMNSIYLWGSITNEDFNPKTGDVDSIAIVENRLKLSKESKIIKEIKKLSPKIKDFKIRFVYLEELNNKKIKGNLTRYITPEQLLYDMKYWKHVCGKKYSSKDFKIKPNLQKIIEDEKGFIKKKINEKRNIPSNEGYLQKAILRLIYYSEQSKGNIFPYSKKGLFKNATGKNKIFIKNIDRDFKKITEIIKNID